MKRKTLAYLALSTGLLASAAPARAYVDCFFYPDPSVACCYKAGRGLAYCVDDRGYHGSQTSACSVCLGAVLSSTMRTSGFDLVETKSILDPNGRKTRARFYKKKTGDSTGGESKVLAEPAAK